jgi:hypothetical protein
MKLNILTKRIYYKQDIKRDDMALFSSAESPMGVFAPKEQRIGGLGRLQVPLYLRGDGCFFGGHQKLGRYWGTVGA